MSSLTLISRIPVPAAECVIDSLKDNQPTFFMHSALDTQLKTIFFDQAKFLTAVMFFVMFE